MRDNDTTPSLPVPNLLVMESWENPLLCPSVVHGTLLHGQDFPATSRSTLRVQIPQCLLLLCPLQLCAVGKRQPEGAGQAPRAGWISGACNDVK